MCAVAAWLGSGWVGGSALAQNAYLLGWGLNADYQASPVPTNVMSGVSAIAAGSVHSLGLKNGAVSAWGTNTYGQTNVPAIALSGVTNIAAGASFSMALKTDGSVHAWGAGIVQTNVPAAAGSGVSAIAAGDWHALALKNGGVLAWGSNSHGQCDVPAELTSNVTAVAAGGMYSMALRSDGGVQVFGIEASHDQAYGIRDVPAEAGSGVAAIAAGRWHALALKNGGVIAWGAPFYDATNVPASATSGVTAISAGDCFSMALKMDGSVVVWGDTSKGQGEIPSYATNGITRIAAGAGHCLVASSVMPPRFLGASVNLAHLGRPYTNGFIYAAGDPAIHFAMGEGPDWLTVNAASGVLGGTPTQNLTNASFSVVITNRLGALTNFYSISVQDVPEGIPEFYTSSPLPDGAVGVPYSLQFAISNKPVVSWIDEGGGLPQGLTLSADGLLSGTPSNVYDSFFTVRATNMLGASNRSYRLTIQLPPSGSEFVTESPLPSGVVGEFYTTQIEATYAPVFSLIGGALPEGLTLGADGVISGYPAKIENPSFTVRATNQVGGTNRVFSLEIFGPPVFVTESPLPRAVLDEAYSQQIEVLGGATFSLESGALPDGLGLSSAGWVTGTPEEIGAFTFTVLATNEYGWTNREYQLAVVEVPVFSTTNPLPDGSLAASYSQQIVASGSPAFSLVGGSLPGGLSLSGAGWVTGTPTQSGPFSFTVRATNAYGWNDRGYDLAIHGFSPPSFTYIRHTNGNIRLEWSNTNAGGSVRVYRATNLTVVPVAWSNLGAQTSPWTNQAAPMPSYYQLRIAP